MPPVELCQSRRFALDWIFILVLLITVPLANAQRPTFTLPNLDQQLVRLTDFRGRWVVVNFWASWCTPCLMEMPELQAFYNTSHDHAVVIGVNFEELEFAKIRQFAKDLSITFPIVLSGGQPVSGFDLKGLPTTFLVSPKGELADTHLGTVNAAMLKQRIIELEKTSDLPR